jgi:hypothetical protein
VTCYKVIQCSSDLSSRSIQWQWQAEEDKDRRKTATYVRTFMIFSYSKVIAVRVSFTQLFFRPQVKTAEVDIDFLVKLLIGNFVFVSPIYVRDRRK